SVHEHAEHRARGESKVGHHPLGLYAPTPHTSSPIFRTKLTLGSGLCETGLMCGYITSRVRPPAPLGDPEGCRHDASARPATGPPAPRRSWSRHEDRPAD